MRLWYTCRPQLAVVQSNIKQHYGPGLIADRSVISLLKRDFGELKRKRNDGGPSAALQAVCSSRAFVCSRHSLEPGNNRQVRGIFHLPRLGSSAWPLPATDITANSACFF